MLNDLCLPLGMSLHDVTKMDELIKERTRLTKGAALYRLGESVNMIYGIRSGSLKTQVEDAGGQVQITGFLLPGEILGLDSLMDNQHVSTAIALEDTEVCMIRLDELDELVLKLPSLQVQLRRLMSKEISRSHRVLMAVGSLRPEQRLAAFLLNLSQRLAALGYSPYEFLLRMTREEIGNFLGLTLETTSRLFSRFGREGVIRVRQREITIVDMQALRILSDTDCG
jgi:CRP/FNR family transcriptional regulator